MAFAAEGARVAILDRAANALKQAEAAAKEAGGAAYAASKHAIIGMARSAALDDAKGNIRVDAILPGNIETPMMDRFTGGNIQKAIDLEPVGRLGKLGRDCRGRVVDVLRPRRRRDRIVDRGRWRIVAVADPIGDAT